MNGRISRGTWMVYAAVAYYYVKIVVCFAVAMLSIVWALYVGLSHYLQYFSQILVWLWAGLALLVFFRDAVRAKQQLELSPDLVPVETFPVRRAAADVEQMVGELCAKRRVAQPKIYVKTSASLESPAGAAIHDAMFGHDVLMLSVLLLFLLPKKDQRAVIAHELRHQNASTNKLKWVLRALLSIFTRVWLTATFVYVLFGLVCLVIGLHRLPSGRSAAVEFLVQPFIGLWLFAAVWTLCSVLRAIMSRSDEIKTDLLSCVDTGDGEALIHALEHLEQIAEENSKRMRSVFRMLGFDEWLAKQNRPEPPWYVRGISHLLWFAAVITHSHPKTSTRRRVIERLFGPAGDTPVLDLDTGGGHVIAIEIVDESEG